MVTVTKKELQYNFMCSYTNKFEEAVLMKSRQVKKVQDIIIKEKEYRKGKVLMVASMLAVASGAFLVNATTVQAETVGNTTEKKEIVTRSDASNETKTPNKSNDSKSDPKGADIGDAQNKVYQYDYTFHTSEGEKHVKISGKANQKVTVKVPMITGKLPDRSTITADFDANGKMTIEGEYEAPDGYVPIFISYVDINSSEEGMLEKGSNVEDTFIMVSNNIDGQTPMQVSGKVGETKEFDAPKHDGYTAINKVKVYFDSDGTGTVLNVVYYQANNISSNLMAQGTDGTSKYFLTNDGVLYFLDGTLDLKQTNDLFQKYKDKIKAVDTSKATGKVYAPKDSSYLFGSKDNTVPSMNIDYNLSKFDTSKVTDMTGMFMQSNNQSNNLEDNRILHHIGLDTFDTSNVNNMKNMFKGINVSDLDLSSFNTQKVTDMSGMFQNSIIQNYLDLSSFDMTNVKNMDDMLNMYLAPNQMVLAGGDEFNKTAELSDKYADDRIYQNIGDGTGMVPKGELIFNNLDGNYQDVLAQLKKTGKKIFVQDDGVVIKSNIGDQLVKTDPTFGTVMVPKVAGYTADKDILDVKFIPLANVGLVNDFVTYNKDPDYTIKVPGYFDDKKVGDFMLQKPLDKTEIAELDQGKSIKVALNKVDGQSSFGGKIIYGTTNQNVIFKNNELQLASGNNKVDAHIIEADILIHYVKADTKKEITQDLVHEKFVDDNKKYQIHIKSLKELGKTISGYSDIYDKSGKEVTPIFVDSNNIQPKDLEQTVKISRIKNHGSSSTNLKENNRNSNLIKQDKTISTFSDKGIVRLYSIDNGITKLVTNRGLAAGTDWFCDEQMTINGLTYDRVATNEWVKANQVYEYQARQTVVKTKNHVTQLVNAEDKVISDRELAKDTAWRSDRYAKLGDSIYDRVATNEFVSEKDVIDLNDK